MLEIDVVSNRLVIKFDKSSQHFERAYVVMRGLLSVSSSGDESGRWSISYDDLLSYKKKLDSLGLVEGRLMTEAAYKYIAEIWAKDKRNEDIKEGKHNDYVKEALAGKLKPTTTLYEDQLAGVSFLRSNWRAGMFDGMGSGKTVQTLSVLVSLQGQVRKTLVICPKSVIFGFTREIQKHTYLKSLAIPSGKAAALEFLQSNVNSAWDIMLVHPENLVNSSAIKGKKSEIYGPITKLLKTIPFDMILVDEWHQYKNLSAKRTKCVLSLLGEIRDRDRNPSRVIVMTGTPISESPLNAYVTLKVLSQDNLPHVSKFESYFTVKKDFTYGNRGTFAKVVGHKNLAELKSRIERVSIRRTKDDMKGYPDKIFSIRDVLLSGKQLDLYKTVCGEVVSSLEHSSIINLGEFFSSASSVRLRQLLNHPAFLEEDCESSKHSEIDLILEELFADAEQKVVIWTEYRKGVDLIFDRWNDQYGVVKIYGGVDIDDKMASAFENEARPRIAACIPAKAGTGVDFLARARTSIYIDRPYSYTLYQQSVDRIHRRVKTEGKLSVLDRIRSQPATIMFMDVPGSIDEVVRDRLMGKQDVADAILTSDEKLIEIGRADLLKFLR